MSLIASALLLLAAPISGQVQLPSPYCTSATYECIRQPQKPPRWTASAFDINYLIYPDPPVPPEPYNYGNWANESDLLAKRFADALVENCSGKGPSCSVNFIGPGNWLSAMTVTNGFVSPVSNGRHYSYQELNGNIGSCGLMTNPPCWFQENLISPNACPVGWTGSSDPVFGNYCYRAKRTNVTCIICSLAGNPIDFFYKEKIQTETDWAMGLLRVERKYRSRGFPDALGAGVIPHPFGTY